MIAVERKAGALLWLAGGPGVAQRPVLEKLRAFGLGARVVDVAEVDEVVGVLLPNQIADGLGVIVERPRQRDRPERLGAELGRAQPDHALPGVIVVGAPVAEDGNFALRRDGDFAFFGGAFEGELAFEVLEERRDAGGRPDDHVALAEEIENRGEFVADVAVGAERAVHGGLDEAGELVVGLIRLGRSVVFCVGGGDRGVEAGDGSETEILDGGSVELAAGGCLLLEFLAEVRPVS